MISKKHLSRSLAATLTVAMIATSNADIALAANAGQGDAQEAYAALAAADKDYQKRPTQPGDFDSMKGQYYYRVYEVPVRMYNAQQEDTYSMANNALIDKAYIMVDSDGKATIKLKFQEVWLEDYQSYGHLMSAKYFENEDDMWTWYKGGEDKSKEVEVEKWNTQWSGDTRNPYPEYISVELPSDSAQISFALAVDAMSAMGMSAQPSILGIHYDEAKELTGKDLAAFYVDQFDNHFNENLYTDEYKKATSIVFNRYTDEYYTHEELIEWARIWVETGKPVSDSYLTDGITNYLGSLYERRGSYLKKDKLISRMNKWLEADQGTFTDDTWNNVLDVADAYVGKLESGDVDEFEVTRIEGVFDEAIDGLKRTDSDKTYKEELREFVNEFVENADDYLPTGLQYFVDYSNYDTVKGYPDTQDELTCRSGIEKLKAHSYYSYVIKKRIIQTKDGMYNAKVTPKQKNEEEFQDTDALKDYLDFENAAVKIRKGLPAITIPVKETADSYLTIRSDSYYIGKDKCTVTAGATKTVTTDAGEKEVPTSIVITLPMQAEVKDTKAELSVMDKTGEAQDLDTVYLDVDYENAEWTEEIPKDQIDKSDLQAAISQYDMTKEEMEAAGYTEEEIEAWQDALEKARQAEASSRKTQKQIDEITEALIAAGSVQSPEEKYTSYYWKAFAVLGAETERAKYPETAVEALEAAVNEAYTIANGDDVKPADYTKAYEIIKEAYEALNEETEVDREALNGKIAEAKAIEAEGYTEESYAALQEAIKAAEAVAEKEDATQEEVNAQVTALDNAIKALEKETVDKKALNDKIAEARAIQAEGYTEESYAALQEAIKAAQTVADKADATQEEVNVQVTALDNAIKALEKETVDKKALNDKIAEAKAIEAEGYTEESYAALQEAIKAAEAVAEKEDATQEEVNAQVTALDNAVKALEEETEETTVNKLALENKLAEANAIGADAYTEESYAALTAAIEAAEAVAADENASQEEVNAQVTALTEAIAGLVKDTSVIADGTYTVPVSLMHAVSGGTSMGNNALEQTATITVEDGAATATLNFKSMQYLGQDGYLGEFGLLEDIEFNDYGVPQTYTRVPADVIEEWDVIDSFNDPENGTDEYMKGRYYPKTVEVPAELNQEETWVYVYVPVMESLNEGSGNQVAKLKIDWSQMEAVDTAVDTAPLEAKISHAESIQAEGYTEESYAALQDAVAQGYAALETGTEEDINAAIAAIDAAVAGLTADTQKPETADKEALNNKIAEAKAIKAEGYTEESYAALQAAIETAQAVADKADASQEEVDAQISALEAAIAALDKEGWEEEFRQTVPEVSLNIREDGSVNISWETVKNAGSYRVYRKEADGSFVGIATLGKDAVSYVDSGAEPGTVYYYTVKAFTGRNLSGISTKYPIDKKIYVPYTEGNFDQIMMNVKAKAGKDRITVTWDPVQGGKSYRVYRKEAGGSFKGIATVSAGTTTYVDKKAKPGVTYCYTVKGFWEEGAKGTATKYPSNVTAGISAQTLKTPAVSTKSVNYCTVDVSWKSVSGAEKYVIYRKEAKAGTSFKSIGTVNADTLKYRDGSAKMGVKYYYTVKAYAGAYYSGYEKNVTGTAVPSSPTLKASGSKKGVTITWTGSKAGANKFADGYRIFRKTENGSWKTVGTVGKNSRSFTDTTGKKGTSYIYTVRAYVKQSNGTNIWGTYNTAGVKGAKK